MLQYDELAARGSAHSLVSLIPIYYAIPFASFLLSMAVLPLFLPHFWEKGYPHIGLVCSLAFAVPFASQYGFTEMGYELLHVLVIDYVPFLLLVSALYITAGGIVFEGKLSGNTRTNVMIMISSLPLASFVGTTGASMILIRPLLRSISHRKYQAHTVVFFIFVSCNIAGALTPLGDPPLFLGFLRDVPFFWPLINLSLPCLLAMCIILIEYFVLDFYLHHLETDPDSASKSVFLKNLQLLFKPDTYAESNDPKHTGIERQSIEDIEKDLESDSASDGGTTVAPTRRNTDFGLTEPTTETISSSAASEQLQKVAEERASLERQDTCTMETAAIFIVQTEEPESLSNDQQYEGKEDTEISVMVIGRPRYRPVGNDENSDSTVSKSSPGVHVEDDTQPNNGLWAENEKWTTRLGASSRIQGWVNVALVCCVAGVVIASGYLNQSFGDYGFIFMKQPSEGPGIIFWSWADFGRNLALLSICLLSVLATPRTHYRENNFSFAPLIEVALIFFNIFITLVPILLMFSAREDGALGFLVRGVTQPWHYFWTTGALSAVLDNSPTYVLFFNVAGGDALILTTEKAAILSAISAGAVFFGAVTYIGNAPNFLVRNVAHEAGVKMPSFVSYVGWSFAVLTPTFAVVTAIFYRH